MSSDPNERSQSPEAAGAPNPSADPQPTGEMPAGSPEVPRHRKMRRASVAGS